MPQKHHRNPSSQPKEHKYKAQKAEYNGNQYDSKREAYMRQLLDTIPQLVVQEKVRIELQAKFRNAQGEAVRAIYIEPDYKLCLGNKVLYVDVKGMIMPDYKIKWKMLQYKCSLEDAQDGVETYFFLPTNNKECLEVLEIVKNFVVQ
jgi:hypothetical protein